MTIKEILKKNPRIDAKALKEGFDLGEQLRRMGVSRRGYRLTYPFRRKQMHTSDLIDSDPRTVQLRHP